MNLKTRMLSIRENLSKHNQWWILIALLLSLCLIVRIHLMLGDVRHTLLQSNEQTKLIISDPAQVASTSCYISELHGATGYAVMLLQPKSSVKTYKECVVQEFEGELKEVVLPLKSPIDEPYQNLDDNCYKYKFMFRGHTYTVYAFPLYKYRTIVGEVHLFYTNDPKFDATKISKIRFDVQIVGRFVE